ncbi:four helix bundle suffix domain-containing protein [Verrucomicrobium sp. BvORR034]|uniref:four helix bundle suffix domain-containing protein n=1 Tax=Verrucomicrobium sp. BvORR034 TaxID=1396418 RepID=UPI0006788547|nr:four helix bundle suffix domain-containing protein [Verrucomicrobium sp. BvORR034]
MSDEPLIPKHGGYRRLKSFQVAQLCYDVTVRFCDRYIERRSRTHDQMVQAARSGVQNIAEGSEASATSKKMELKLTQVARASLEELKLDYEDYLRHRSLPLWPEDDPRRKALVARRCATADEVALWVKEVWRQQDGRNGGNGPDGQTLRGKPPGHTKGLTYAEPSANAVHVLIGVACSLLDRQVAALAAAFEKEGGFTERLYRTRQQRRNRP